MNSEFFRGLWVVAYREIARMLRDPARLASSFIMPLMFLVVFGAGFGRTIGNMAPGVNFIKFLFPGIVAQTVCMTSLMSGVSVVWDREFGFMRELLVAPINRLGIVGGKVAGTVVVAMFQGLIILVLAPLIGVAVSFATVVKLVALIVVMSVALSSLGLLLAVWMRSQQAFQLFMQVMIFPMIFLAGIFFPLNNVPTWLAVIAKFNPLTYGVDAVRHAFLDGAGGGTGFFSVALFGHKLTMIEDTGIMLVIGATLLVVSSLAFGRRA